MSTTNILDLNNRVNVLEKAVSGGDSTQANKKDIATEFNTTTNYTAGCFVYYGGKLYQFNADHAAGAWDPTDVVEANVTDQVVSNKAAIDGLTASDVSYDNTDSGLTATSVQGAVDELANKLGTEQLLKEVTADGVKTYSELLVELYTALSAYSGFTQLRIGASYYSPVGATTFNRIRYSSNAFHFEAITIGSSNATYHVGDMSDGGSWTHTNNSATVPTEGIKIGAYKVN